MFNEFVLVIRPIILAILGGIGFYATSSFLKSGEKFEAEKFFLTIFIGLIVGFVAYLLGIDYEPALQLLISTGAIVAIETWGKFIYRKIKERIEGY